MEKYMTLALGSNIVFKDSMMFMCTSLQKLADNLLAAGRENFKLLRAEFPGISEEQLQLLLRKGVFPYDYLDSWERLDEPTLPPKEKFYNKLRSADLSESDYEHALKVWQAFNCKTIRDYMNLYLKCTLCYQLLMHYSSCQSFTTNRNKCFTMLCL